MFKRNHRHNKHPSPDRFDQNFGKQRAKQDRKLVKNIKNAQHTQAHHYTHPKLKHHSMTKLSDLINPKILKQLQNRKDD